MDMAKGSRSVAKRLPDLTKLERPRSGTVCKGTRWGRCGCESAIAVPFGYSMVASTANPAVGRSDDTRKWDSSKPGARRAGYLPMGPALSRRVRG